MPPASPPTTILNTELEAARLAVATDDPVGGLVHARRARTHAQAQPDARSEAEAALLEAKHMWRQGSRTTRLSSPKRRSP